MGRHCPYCPTVLKGLQALLQDRLIGKLETVVIEEHPDRAAELGVRSVPWVRIGPFELAGLRSERELRDWAEKAGSMQGTAKYIGELLSTGAIDRVLELVRDDDTYLKALLMLLANPGTELNVRIGISAVMESLQATPALRDIAPELRELTRHQEPAIRGDACYFLALSRHPDAPGWIRPLLGDPDDSVREIAAEGIAELAGQQ